MATLETTVDELSFIPWSEVWGCPMVDTSAGIHNVQLTSADARQHCYNLAGLRVAQPQKGLYIMDGKKYLKR